MSDAVIWVAAWWVIGLVVVSTFLLTIRRHDAPVVFDGMRQHRDRAVRLLIIEAWIWPLYLIGLLALALGPGGDALMPDLFPDAPKAVSIDDQIAYVKREIGYREHVYGRRVADKKMTQALADKQINLMRAVLATLEKVKAGDLQP